MSAEASRSSAPTRFAIVGFPRSGTTLLVRLLHSHSGAWVYGEVFSRGARVAEAAAGWRRDTFERLFSHGLSLQYPRLAAPPADIAIGPIDDPNASIRAVGYKHLLPRDWRRPSLRARLWPKRRDIATDPRRFLLADPAIRIVWLRRRNVLARLVSLKRSARHGIGHSFDPADRARDSVEIRFEELLCFAEAERSVADRVRAELRGHACFELDYEDLIAGPEPIERLQDFLGLPVERLVARSIRLDGRPLHEAVTNFTSLREACAGTPLARHLEDPA